MIFFLLMMNTSWEGFTNIAKNVLTKQEKDIWINMLSYRDQKHRDEFVAKTSSDKERQEGYEEFTKLITPRLRSLRENSKDWINKNMVK